MISVLSPVRREVIARWYGLVRICPYVYGFVPFPDRRNRYSAMASKLQAPATAGVLIAVASLSFCLACVTATQLVVFITSFIPEAGVPGSWLHADNSCSYRYFVHDFCIVQYTQQLAKYQFINSSLIYPPDQIIKNCEFSCYEPFVYTTVFIDHSYRAKVA